MACLPLPDDAQLAQCVAAGGGQCRGAWKKPAQPGDRGLDRFTKPLHQSCRQGARRGHGDLLAQDGAHGQLKAVQGAGHAQTVAPWEAGAQQAADGAGIRIQIEHGPHARHHPRQHLAQRITQAQIHAAASSLKAG